jgi:hypothetical protein
MKITGITVIFTYANGDTIDVSEYVPAGIYNDLENFADCWQEDEEDEEDEDEC